MNVANKRISVLCNKAKLPEDAVRELYAESMALIKCAFDDGLCNDNYERDKVEAMAHNLAKTVNAPNDIAKKIQQVCDYHIRWANCTGLIDVIDPRLQSLRPEILELLDELDEVSFTEA
ncbi:hypothetical protein GWO13_10000 [Candidatus Bathyarchaeota archaeon]|nr:hypothetical protein [Candidatus Bathyarchaeota archaeon]